MSGPKSQHGTQYFTDANPTTMSLTNLSVSGTTILGGSTTVVGTLNAAAATTVLGPTTVTSLDATTLTIGGLPVGAEEIHHTLADNVQLSANSNYTYTIGNHTVPPPGGDQEIVVQTTAFSTTNNTLATLTLKLGATTVAVRNRYFNNANQNLDCTLRAFATGIAPGTYPVTLTFSCSTGTNDYLSCFITQHL